MDTSKENVNLEVKPEIYAAIGELGDEFTDEFSRLIQDYRIDESKMAAIKVILDNYTTADHVLRSRYTGHNRRYSSRNVSRRSRDDRDDDRCRR